MKNPKWFEAMKRMQVGRYLQYPRAIIFEITNQVVSFNEDCGRLVASRHSRHTDKKFGEQN